MSYDFSSRKQTDSNPHYPSTFFPQAGRQWRCQNPACMMLHTINQPSLLMIVWEDGKVGSTVKGWRVQCERRECSRKYFISADFQSIREIESGVRHAPADQYGNLQ